MFRKIIKIDESKCDACGLCVNACHENAIGIVNGKAKLLRDDYCDGLGNCLPVCPQNAISFEEREAAAFDENVFEKNKTGRQKNWPLQIKLVNTSAAFFDNCNLLIAADCTAYSYKNFYDEFIDKQIPADTRLPQTCVLIACPKLDDVDYSIKLSQIIKDNNIKTITITRMEVPCCGGIEFAVKEAVLKSGKTINTKCVTFSVDGKKISEE